MKKKGKRSLGGLVYSTDVGRMCPGCISGLEMHGNELKKLAKELKQQCGSGGSIKAGVIEIQGDHRDTLEKVLTQRGYKVKRAGG